MTVKELIGLLQYQDQEAVVIVGPMRAEIGYYALAISVGVIAVRIEDGIAWEYPHHDADRVDAVQVI